MSDLSGSADVQNASSASEKSAETMKIETDDAVADEESSTGKGGVSSVGDEADSSDSDDESTEGISNSASNDKKLAKALGLKDAGNTFFKNKEFDKAVRSYRRGTSCIKGLNEANSGDDQVKALLVSLQNNMAMVLAKQLKWKQVSGGGCGKVAASQAHP